MALKLPTVAIIGQANVGKSSLFNRLVKSKQAIVAQEAGTTRDNVTGRVEYKEHAFWLVDTAGLKDPDDELKLQYKSKSLKRQMCRHDFSHCGRFKYPKLIRISYVAKKLFVAKTS